MSGEMRTCHPRCALGPDADHPGYREYRCMDQRGESLPWPGEEGYQASLQASRYDGWEPWEDATWD